MIGTAAVVSACAVETFQWNARSRKPTDVSRYVRGIVPPTLFTTTSIRPNASFAAVASPRKLRLVVEVRDDDVRLAAESFDRRRDRAQLLLGARRDHDVRARLGERDRRSGADAAPRAGDDRDAVIEPEPIQDRHFASCRGQSGQPAEQRRITE